MWASPPRPPTAEERGHSLELVTMTEMKTTVPNKREGAVKRRKKSKREMPALLVKVKTRTTQEIAPPADGTESCCDVGWLPDRTVVSIWR